MKKLITIILSFMLILTVILPASAFSTIAVKGIKLDKSTITLKVGQTYTLKATLTPKNTTQKKLTYATANKNIATIDKNGKIKGVGNGTTTISVYTQNKKISAKCKVSVTQTGIEKKLTISWFVNGGKEVLNGNVLQKELEAKFNVKIVNVVEDMNNTEKMNLLWSSGEGPDAGFSYLSPTNLYKQGLIRTIPKSYILKYAPNQAKMYDANPTGWVANAAKDKKDEYIALNGLNKSNGSDGMISYYRLDWLEKLGIKPKGKLIQCDDRVFFTQESFSLDELQTIFKGFTNNDPDGNGKKDTWGMTGMDYESYTWGSILQAFQLKTEFDRACMMQEDGKLKIFFATEKFKSFLTYANSLYKKGYIDPEFSQLDWTKSVEKMTSGMVGWCTMAASYTNPTYTDRPPYGILNSNPNAKILTTPPEKGPDGKMHFTPWNAITDIGYTFLIGAKVNDEKLKRILIMYDYINYGPEKLRFYIGEEGTQWKWSGEPNNSIIVIDPDKSTDADKGKIGFGHGKYRHVIYDDFFNLFVNTNKEFAPVCKFLASTKGLGIQYIPNYRYDMMNTTNFMELDKQYGSEIATILKEYYVKAIVGEASLDDAGWNDYLSRLNKAGMQKLVDEYAKAPLVSDLIKGKVN